VLLPHLFPTCSSREACQSPAKLPCTAAAAFMTSQCSLICPLPSRTPPPPLCSHSPSCSHPGTSWWSWPMASGRASPCHQAPLPSTHTLSSSTAGRGVHRGEGEGAQGGIECQSGCIGGVCGCCAKDKLLHAYRQFKPQGLLPQQLPACYRHQVTFYCMC
jgi:hypothetical protein